jgi:hypothetical protein
MITSFKLFWESYYLLLDAAATQAEVLAVAGFQQAVVAGLEPSIVVLP